MSDDARVGIDKRRSEGRHGLTGTPLDQGMLTAWDAAHPRELRLQRFLENAVDARDNGYDLICAECGCGIYDDSDLHDSGCSHEADDE